MRQSGYYDARQRRNADVSGAFDDHIDVFAGAHWRVDVDLGHVMCPGALMSGRLATRPNDFWFSLNVSGRGTAGCVHRLSQHATFADATPFAEALLARVPDRLIWGSDYPHLSFHDRVGTIALYNLLDQWVPDAAMRKRILVDNPAALFGFA